MFTTCPACQTVFRLTAATLRAAHGQVVCVTCNTTFDALFGLSDEPPAGTAGKVRSLAPPEDDLPANPSLDQVAAALADAGVLLEELDDPGALDEVTLLHIPGTASPEVTGGAPAVAQALAEDAARSQRRAVADTWPEDSSETPLDAPAAAPEPLPATQVELHDDEPTGTWASLPDSATAGLGAAEPVSFAATLEAVSAQPATDLQGQPLPDPAVETTTDAGAAAEEALEPWMEDAEPPRRGWAWTLGSVALLLLLAAQALHHWREPLAHHPTLGPAVVTLYAALGEPLAPELNLRAYTVTQGRVDAAAEAGALRVSAVITNRTGVPQERPLLQVTLEDRYGAPIGRRTFHPEEYAANSATPTSPMAPHEELPAMVEVADPGNEAVGFKLDVCIFAASVLHCASDPADGSAAPTP